MPAEGAITTARPDARASAPSGRSAAVRLDGVSVRYGDLEALSSLSLSVAPDEVVAVVGPSGCGKTTLLELVCGLLLPSSGSVASEPAALMPQRDALLPWLSALDNAALPLRVQGVGKDSSREAAHALLSQFGLAGFEASRPDQLSGGMRQRVAFVRTLLAGRTVLALDEPFSALDAITRAEMQAWLANALAAEPRTVVLVTHDVEEALLVADRVVILSPRPGRIVQELRVERDRPRSPTDPHIVALRAQALEALARR
jgi:NitT/TauT family transport system ATP-binding protein